MRPSRVARVRHPPPLVDERPGQSPPIPERTEERGALLEERPRLRVVPLEQRQRTRALQNLRQRRGTWPPQVDPGDFGEVLVTDWGLAKTLPPRTGSDAEPESTDLSQRPTLDKAGLDAADALWPKTKLGNAFGTPGFMSPEQILGMPLDAIVGPE